MEENTKKVLKQSGKGLLIACAILIFAFYTAPCINIFVTKENITLYRLGAFGLVAWAVLGRSGFEIQSYKSSSSSEKINKYIYLIIYCVGLYSGAIGLLVGKGL